MIFILFELVVTIAPDLRYSGRTILNFKRALIHILTLIFHEHKESLP